MEQLTIEEATDFFAEFFMGKHHIPSDVIPFGNRGYSIACKDALATTDFDGLTKLVVMAHDKCIRTEIIPKGMNRYLIAIWKRKREGDFSKRHPTIEESIERIRGYKKHK